MGWTDVCFLFLGRRKVLFRVMGCCVFLGRGRFVILVWTVDIFCFCVGYNRGFVVWDVGCAEIVGVGRRRFLGGLVGSICRMVSSDGVVFLQMLLFLLVKVMLNSYAICCVDSFGGIRVKACFDRFLSFLKAGGVDCLRMLLEDVFGVTPVILVVILLNFALVKYPMVLFVSLMGKCVLKFAFTLLTDVLKKGKVVLLTLKVIVRRVVFVPYVVVLDAMTIGGSVVGVGRKVKGRELGGDEVGGGCVGIRDVLDTVLVVKVFVRACVSPGLVGLMVAGWFLWCGWLYGGVLIEDWCRKPDGRV